MMDYRQQTTVWWGRHAVAEGRCARWQVGPLTIWVQRLAIEWRIAFARASSKLPQSAVAVATATACLPEENLAQYVFHHSPEALRILPALADRPVVTRPVTPVHVLPGEEATVFVSTPLWLRIDVGEPWRRLLELAIERPSDTWFGPSTQQGELCYAVDTRCHLYRQEVAARPDRAITPVVIRNQGDDPMLVERLNLPVLYLALFEARNGNLWTQSVVMKREREKGLASVDIGRGPPPQEHNATLVAEPRRHLEKNVLNWAFNALFDNRG